MSDINSTTLAGRLGQDPELKYFDSGAICAEFALAVNEWQGKDKGEKTHWLPCIVWGKQAEYLSTYGKNGSYIALQGLLQADSYTAKDGTNRKKVYVKVENISVMNKEQS